MDGTNEDRGEAAALQPKNTSNNNHNMQSQTAHNPKRSVIRAATASTRMATAEAIGTAKTIKYAWSAVFSGLFQMREAAKQDREDAEKDPEALWDEVVAQSKITLKSVRSRYALAYRMDLVILTVFAAGIGFTWAKFGHNNLTLMNVILCNMVFISHISQIHKLYIAREQRIITGGQLLVQIFKNPSLLIPQPLPDDYALRQSTPTPGKETC
ncbi:hypothetical protein [Geopseudomonas aromaticivorans]